MREELEKRLKTVGQEDVLRWWPDLGDEERERLAEEIRGLDLDLVSRLSAQIGGSSGESTSSTMKPPEIIRKDSRAKDARAAGEEAIRQGKVACMIVAGGQASRLGIDHPKGTFPIGPVSEKSLFQILAEKIRASGLRYGVEIPLVLLTSRATDAATRLFFEERKHFGLSPDRVRFLRQGSIPAFGLDGKILLKSKGEIFRNPNGHGGSILALWDSGILDGLRDEGYEILSYIQVDNPLALPVDPVTIGLHILEGAEVSSKVAEKTDPDERVGVFAVRDGRLEVVEYSELSDRDRHARDDSGRLVFRGGNLAMHAWSLSFLDRLRSEGVSLPYHEAHKAIPCIDGEGQLVEAGGVKFETFVFDAIPHAHKGIIVEVDRTEEFQPVKGQSGPDTPEDARRALVRLHSRWVERVAEVPHDDSGEPVHPIEISPLLALDEEEFLRIAPAGLVVEGPLYLGPETA
jgi:UDP-N-acetylglucosamine/UDP-N-acetylgalactosamine diphosphorylase